MWTSGITIIFISHFARYIRNKISNNFSSLDKLATKVMVYFSSTFKCSCQVFFAFSNILDIFHFWSPDSSKSVDNLKSWMPRLVGWEIWISDVLLSPKDLKSRVMLSFSRLLLLSNRILIWWSLKISCLWRPTWLLRFMCKPQWDLLKNISSYEMVKSSLYSAKLNFVGTRKGTIGFSRVGAGVWENKGLFCFLYYYGLCP